MCSKSEHFPASRLWFQFISANAVMELYHLSRMYSILLWPDLRYRTHKHIQYLVVTPNNETNLVCFIACLDVFTQPYSHPSFFGF